MIKFHSCANLYLCINISKQLYNYHFNVGVDRDPWLCGAMYTCKECHQAKQKAQVELKELLDRPRPITKQTEDQIEAAKLNVIKKKYAFRSYNPKCLDHWMSKYPHIALTCEVHVTHRYQSPYFSIFCSPPKIDSNLKSSADACTINRFMAASFSAWLLPEALFLVPLVLILKYYNKF